MFSDEGLKIWLGELEDELTLKKPYNTKDGIQGIVRVFTPYSHIRMSWKKENWQNTSTVQVRVMGNREKSTVSFHHEKLSDETQREEVRLFWNEKMAEIEKILSKKI